MGNFCFASKKQKPQKLQILSSYTEDDVKNLVNKWQGSMIGYFKQRFQDVASSGIQFGLERKDFIILFPDLQILPKKVFDNVFNFFDNDHSGHIDFREFCQSLSIVFYSNLEFQNSLVFQIFDIDDDNYWSKVEVKNFIKVMYKYIIDSSQQQDDYQQGIIEENDNQKIKLNEKQKKKQGKKQEQQQYIEIEKNMYKFIQDHKLNIQGNTNLISVQGFKLWASQYFNTKEFLEIFQLVPNPLREREIIRNLFKEHQINSNINNQTPQLASKNDSLMINNNNFNLSNNIKKESLKNISQHLPQGITEKKESYYVVSWKWWWLWKYYINKSYKQYLLEQQQNGKYNQRNNQFQNKIDNAILENENENQEKGDSSNVSLVDMELNTIPSERKNNQSIVMKMDPIFKMQDKDKLHGFVTPPGELIQNIQDELMQQDQIPYQKINQKPPRQQNQEKQQKKNKSKVQNQQFQIEKENNDNEKYSNQSQTSNQNKYKEQHQNSNNNSSFNSQFNQEDLDSPKFNEVDDKPPQIPNTGDLLKPTKEYSMDNCQVPSDHNENVNIMPSGVENKASLREQQYNKKSNFINKKNKSIQQFQLNQQIYGSNSPVKNYQNNTQQTPQHLRSSDIVNFETTSPNRGNDFYSSDIQNYKPNNQQIFIHNIHSNNKNNKNTNQYTMNQNLDDEQTQQRNDEQQQNINNLSTQQEHADFINNNKNKQQNIQQIQVQNSNFNIEQNQQSDLKQKNISLSNQQSPKISIENMKQHFERGQDQIYINQHNSNNDKSEIVSGDNLLSGECEDIREQNNNPKVKKIKQQQNQQQQQQQSQQNLDKLQIQPKNTPENSLNILNQQIQDNNYDVFNYNNTGNSNVQQQQNNQNDQIQSQQFQKQFQQSTPLENNLQQQTIQKLKKQSISSENNTSNKCYEKDINLDMNNQNQFDNININLEKERYTNMENNLQQNDNNLQKQQGIQGGEIVQQEANELSQKDMQQKLQTQGDQQNNNNFDNHQNLQERNNQLLILEQQNVQQEHKYSMDISPGKVSKISRKNSQKQLSNGDLNTNSNFNYEEEDEFKQQNNYKQDQVKDSVMDLNLSKKVNFQSPQLKYYNQSTQKKNENNQNELQNEQNNKSQDSIKANKDVKEIQDLQVVNIQGQNDQLQQIQEIENNNKNKENLNQQQQKQSQSQLQQSQKQQQIQQQNQSQILNNTNLNNDISVFEPNNNQHHVYLEGNNSQWFNTEGDDQDIINQKDEDYEQLLQNKENQQQTIIQHYETYQTIGERPPNIDNYDLEGEFEGELKQNLMQNHDYILLPESIWNHLYKWYRGNPQFKRKRIRYYKSGKQIVELYPPYLYGYQVKQNGYIDYQSKKGKLCSSRKNFEQVLSKFSKIMKINMKVSDIVIYYRKLGEEWEKVENMNQRLVDCQCESGTILVFLNKKQENKFKQIIEDQQQLRAKNNEEGNNNYDPTLIEIGDFVDIRHHFTNNQWKLGYLVEINETSKQYRFHFKKETYKNDLIIQKQDLDCFIGPPKQYSKTQRKMSIDKQQQQGFTPKLLGLANIGNTCFLNCILQCLIHTPLFREYLLQDGFLSEDGVKKNQIIQKMKRDSQVLLMQEVSNLAKYLQQNQYNDPLNPFQPYSLKKAIDIEMNQFSGHEQHDAQEFLNFFLDFLLEEQKEINSIQQQMNQPKQQQQNQNEKDKKKKDSLQQNQQIEQIVKDKENNKNKKEKEKEKDKDKEQNKNKYNVKGEQLKQENNHSNQQQNISKELSEKNPQQDKYATGQKPNQEEIQNSSQKQQKDSINSDKQENNTKQTDQKQNQQEGSQNDKEKDGNKQKQESQNTGIKEKQQDETNQDTQNTQSSNLNNKTDSSIIKDLYMGITRNTITCQDCQNVNYKYEDFMSVSIPIPVVNEQFYEVTYYARCENDIIPKPRKYGVKISKYDSIETFTKAFEQVSGIPESQFVFAEVYRHGIHQNFYFSDKSELVKNLGFRSNDEICCYEILKNSQSLLDEMLTLSKQNLRGQKSFKCNLYDFIDVIDTKGKWRYGQIVQVKSVSIRRSTEKQSRHKNSGSSEEHGSQKEIQLKIQMQKQGIKEHEWYRLQGNRISGFRTNSIQAEKEAAFLYVVTHRRYNKNLGKLEKFGTPLMITIMQWITWKELHYIVYNQVKRFIDFTYLQNKKDTQKYKEQQRNFKAQDDIQLQRLNSEFNASNNINQLNALESYVNERSQKHKNTTKIDSQGNQINQLAFSQNYIQLDKQESNDQNDNLEKSPQIQNRLLRGLTTNPKHIHKQSLDLDGKISIDKKNQILKKSVNVDNKKNAQQNFFSQEITEKEFLKDMTLEEFIQSNDFPYHLKLVDQYSERCVSCDKLINYNKKVQNPQDFCDNCQFGFEDVPIMWNVNNTSNISLAIDWKDSLAFNPFSIVPQQDKSNIQIKKEKSIAENQIQLNQCLNLFSKEEKVELVCDKCKTMKEQTIKTQIDTLPNILVVHLKRFYFQQGYLEKLDNFVNCPKKGLSLQPWSTENNKKNGEQNSVYDLYAVSNHIGNGSGGHYTAYVQVKGEESAQQKWVSFDDENVSFISQDKIISNQSYLLFYKKRQIQSSTIVNLTFRPIGV